MSETGTNNKNVIWGWALAAGVIAFVLLKFVAAYAFWPALFLAILIGILVALLVWIGFYRDDEDETGLTGAAPAAPAETSAPRTAAAPEAAAPAPEPTPAAPKPAPAPKAEAKAKTEAEAKEVPAAGMMGNAGHALKAANEGKPAALKAPRGGKADDLKKIKGVGPKLEKLLNSMGYFHFDQIASWTESEVAWVDANLQGFKGRVSRDNWVEQARTLAAGGETEFSKKVDKGGMY